jgi:hypothetical protein
MKFNKYLQDRLSEKAVQNSAIKIKKGFLPKLIFIILGLAASVWVLIRLIPKPSRANYPCMKVAFPVATSFVIYISGLVASVYFFQKAGKKIKERKLLFALPFIFIAALSLSVALFNKEEKVSANITDANRFDDPLGSNKPIGEGKGIIPGRVVWVHNPDATNISCTNNNQNDAYWLAKNCDQQVVDQMFSEALKKVSGKETQAEAWDAVFKYFNKNHSKGEIGYQKNETIFIKVNAVTAYGGATSNGGKQPASVAIEYDTTPQAILSMLRQLVNVAGVPQKNIYVGDPLADLWDHMYQYFHTEFPNVNYVSHRNISNRYRLKASSEGIHYSDRGTVIDELPSNVHYLYQEMVDADYLINIPVMKGHRWGGVTFFAKNHFGSNTTEGSWQLHKGLMNPDNNGMRNDYGLYRVQVDLMGNKYLGGNTLIYFMDALWSTSYEHQRPQKFQTAPFNNDWSSSILMSLDPVAIESVGIDLMQKEFTDEEIIDGTGGTAIDRFAFVQWDGIDDYLHQAASSEYWTDGIEYDPEDDGTPIGSLGVHEHWNNVNDMKYSRNLGNGQGIELVMIEQTKSTGIQTLAGRSDFKINVYPNPVIDRATLKINKDLTGNVEINIFSSCGKHIKSFSFLKSSTTDETTLDLSGLVKGNYIVRIHSGDQIYASQFSKI